MGAAEAASALPSKVVCSQGRGKKTPYLQQETDPDRHARKIGKTPLPLLAAARVHADDEQEGLSG
jgi:hypothetical protein